MDENRERFEEFVVEALQQQLRGWDFRFLEGRWIEGSPSWDYREKVLTYMKGAQVLLDMGTGGGEFLCSLLPLPAQTVATEGYAPNVPYAKARLEPLGVKVVELGSDDRLPFEDETFEVIINRHESFLPKEVYRVLKPGGWFVTQQVGGRDNLRLNELLGASTEVEYADWGLAFAVKWLGEAGFDVVEQLEAYPETIVKDIGAVVFYLNAIPWQISDFCAEAYEPQLFALHNLIEEAGEVVLQSHRFFIVACKS